MEAQLKTRKKRSSRKKGPQGPREDDAKGAQQSPIPPPPPPYREGGEKEAQKNLTSSSASPPVRDDKEKGRRKGARREEPEEERYDFEPLEYLEFRLQIGRGKTGGFEVEVQDSPAGRARAEIDLPLDAASVERQLKGLWALRKDRHERELAEEVDATVGSKLFDALGGDVLRSFENSINGLRGLATGGAGYGLRIRLLAGSPAASTPLDQDKALAEDLLRVGSQPWEYLYNTRAGRLLGRLACNHRFPIVRSLDTPYFVKPLEVDGPLRILVVDCVPEDQRPLETEKERRELRSAIEGAEVERVILLTDPTIPELRNKLRRINPHILHFIGHGDFDDALGDGYLCLVGDDGKTDRLRADELGQMLDAVSSTLRLVFLNSCRTAQYPRRNGQDPWSATAAEVLRAGVPAVIAMQFPISDPAAIAFSTGFYRALKAGEPLEAAVAEGRIEIQSCVPWEWGIPVLYLNAMKGELFTPKTGGAAPWRSEDEPLKLGIRSFIGWAAGMKSRVDQMLALDPYFEGRFIRSPELWTERVAPKLSRFLKRWVKGDRPVELEMAAHQTLAFLTGYLLDAKGGIPLTLIQRSEGKNPELWSMDVGEIPPDPLWTVEESHLGSPEGDVAVAIGVTRPVLGDVEHYLRTNGVPVGRLISLTLPETFNHRAVKSGAHAAALAQELSNLIDSRNPAEKCRTLHILGSAPNAFFLYLGRKARGFGEIQLYEYDLEKTGHKGYQPSLRLPLGKA